MIRDQWYGVLESGEVPRGRPVAVRRMGESLVFWRDAQGSVVCQRDLCPHRGVALSRGKLQGDTLECPFHGIRFDAAGACRLVPANGSAAPPARQIKVVTYPAREAHGLVYIWWGQPPDGAALPPVPFFDDIDGSFGIATVRDPWNTHYSRAIENQLDVAHLPFVHANSIGRGGRALVDGPLLEWIGGDRFRVYVFNRLDDGTPPRRPQELARPEVPFHLEFVFPNLWQNHIGPDTRIVVAFAPIDDEHTMLYLRFYQRFVRAPILRDIVARLAMPLNVYIAHQDRFVVQTQLPKRSGLKIGERLIQADRPIVAYRTHRQELIERAGRPVDPATEE